MSSVNLRSRSCSAILILVTVLLSSAVGVQGEASVNAIGELEKIAKAYKIEIVTADARFAVKTTHGRIKGKNADRKELQDYVSLFVPEFALYPPGLVQRSQLKRVMLCSELSFAGQRRNAIPDYEHDTLYLDVCCGTYGKTYLRKVIHHELFHIIDYWDDWNVYQDEDWASLNPAKFKYGSGSPNAQELEEESVLTDKFPGFLNYYSTTGVEEDKAEVFANLIVDLEYVEDRAKKDRVLDAKVERMKELLVKFCPEMNDKFWEKVRKMKRAEM